MHVFVEMDSPSVVPQLTLPPVKYSGMSTTTILLMMLVTFLALGGFVVLVVMVLNAIRKA